MKHLVRALTVSRSLLVAGGLCLSALPVLAQSTTPNVTPVTREHFRAEVKKEISNFKNGEILYRKSDLFQRIIDARVATRLGLTKAADRALGSEAEIENEPDAAEGSTVFDVSKTSNDEDETSIAVNRSNPEIIVAGANDDAMYTNSMPAYLSTNSGQSWKTYRLPQIHYYGCVAGGDPMIVSNDKGMFYYAFLIYSQGSGNTAISDIMVARSTDGRTWTLGNPALGDSIPSVSFEDKETIATDNDPASPHYGRLYLAWVHYGGDGTSTQRIVWSDDQGATWSAPNDVSTDYGYFPLLRVGKGGTVYLSTSSPTVFDHGFFVSKDGGESFVQSSISTFVDYPENLDGRSGLKGDNGFRSFPYVSFDVDMRDNTLFATFGTWDKSTYASLYTEKSTDDGLTWTTPVAIGSTGLLAKDHFLPWVSYDQELHEAFVSYYSSEEDPLNETARFVRVPFDSIKSPTALGTRLFDPANVVTPGGGPFLGDYVGSDAYKNVFAAAWTENRPSHTDGEVFAYVSSPANPGKSSVRQINAKDLTVGDIYPNPSTTDHASISVQSKDGGEVDLQVTDNLGHTLFTKRVRIGAGSSSTIDLDLTELPAGSYRCVISSDGEIYERQIVRLK